MADFYLVVDTGGSQTKIIYQLPGQQKPQYFLMPPHVEPIAKEDLQRYQEQRGWLGSPAPIQQAWITVENAIWVVGAFADDFDPADRLQEKKYENALYKVLAVVGLLIQQHGNLKKRQHSIALGVLLPWEEFGDRKRFKSQIEAMLTSFTFQSTKLAVKVTNFVCQPEGGGLAATCLRRKGMEWFQSQRLAVLLFGHRNTSLLNFEKGRLVDGSSPLYGFSVFVDEVINNFGTLDRDALARAIFEGSEQRNCHYAAEVKQRSSSYLSRVQVQAWPDSRFSWQKQSGIKALVTAKLPKLRKKELEDLVTSITKAEEFYWGKLQKWLDQRLPRACDQVIISGGAALFLLPKLKDYLSDTSVEPERLNQKIEEGILWDGALKPTLNKVFSLNDDALVARLADAYGLFDHLLSLEK